MRAAIYLRQSLDRNDDQLAVSRQREACQQLCADRGWQTVEYVDNDTSASTRKPRPQYEQMLSDVRAGKLDAIVCWHPDRLYRQPRDLEDIIDLANAHNVRLATVSGDLDLSTDMGRMVARMVGAVNRGEVERKSARQKAAGKQRAKTGAASWSVRPFGYADLKGEKLDEREAELIRAAYRVIIQGGSLYAIAEEWNKAGVPTPRGNRWRGSQVRSVLINPRNAGRRTYNGEDIGEATWPAIVDYDMWQAAHAVLADPGRRLTKTQGRVHLLSGIAVCGVCGASVRAGKAFQTKQAVYWCTAKFCVSRKLVDVDRWVEEHVIQRLSKPDAHQVVQSRRTTPDLNELRDRAATLRARLEGLAVDYADGILTSAQLRIANDRIRENLTDVEAQLADANAARVFDGLIGISDVRSAWENLSLDRKRAVVDALMTVKLLPAGQGVRRFDPSKVLVSWRV